METTTLTIHVRKSVYKILEEKAMIRGRSVEEYIVDLLEKDAGEQLSADESPKKSKR